MDKDRGYAWVIVGASTFLMLIGPATYTATGFLLYEAPLTHEAQSWILTVFYVFWTLSGILAGCYAKERPRQLSTTGAALACVGFISSASAVQNSSYLYLTYSVAVGFGLGLAFHTAYLMVMNNFEKYKGIANAVCQTFVALGQLLVPILYSAVSMPRDRFNVRTLTAAIGFLTTLFFVVPSHTDYQRRMSMVGDRNRRHSSGVSRRSSLSEGVPLRSGCVSSEPSNGYSNQNQGQARTRRRSQYLLAVSTSLLPNIPEEPESTHSTNGTLTSMSSDSEMESLSKNLSTPSINGIAMNAIQTEEKDSKENEEIMSKDDDVDEGESSEAVEVKIIKPHQPLRRLSEGCSPAYVGNLHVGRKLGENRRPMPPQTLTFSTGGASYSNQTRNTPNFRRYSESQLGSPLPLSPVSGGSDTLPGRSLSVESTSNMGSPLGRSPAQQQRANSSQGESMTDFRFFQDVHFLNMATFTALCTVALMNFPNIFYFFILSKCEDCKAQANTALIIIYIVDLISRPLFSYLSDYSFLCRRKMFLLGSLFGGITVAVTPLLNNFTLIYCTCVLFGMCSGLMLTSEYLMFIDEFGTKRFSQAYGILNLFKLVAVVIIGVIYVNPLGAFLYPIHPFDVARVPKNISLICDDLNILDTTNSSNHIQLLITIALPTIFCAIAWAVEDIYKATQKCSVQSANKTLSPTNSNNTPNDVP